MVAVPEVCSTAPDTGAGAPQLAVLTRCRRMVAITGTAMELLRPESDLLRIISGSPHVDLLVASVDEPVAARGRLGVLGDLTPEGSSVDPGPSALPTTMTTIPTTMWTGTATGWTRRWPRWACPACTSTTWTCARR